MICFRNESKTYSQGSLILKWISERISESKEWGLREPIAEVDFYLIRMLIANILQVLHKKMPLRWLLIGDTVYAVYA